MYLFDTDIITNIFKKKPSRKLITKLSALEKSCQFITTTTIAEIVYSAWKSENPKRHLDNLEQILLPAVNIVGFDSKAAYLCGAIRADLEKVGRPLSLADLEIAAIALANNLTLITGNTKHFSRIPKLQIENWFE